MARQLEPLSQNDSRWQNIHLGLSTTVTLGQAGCFVTSFSVLAYYYNHQVLPDGMNSLLVNENLFADQNLISSDDDLAKLFTDITYIQTNHFENTPADLHLLQELMADPTKSVIVEIDLGNGQVHFTPVIDCDGTNVTIMNVWDGKVEDLKSVYGDPATKILKYVVYQGTVAQDPAPDILEEIKQADFLKLDQKSIELDKVGAYLQFSQTEIDSLGFSDKVIAKIEEIKNSTPAQPSPEATQTPISTPVQPLTSSQTTLLQRMLALIGLKLG